MTSMMEGMTVTFLPERPAIQLTKECSPGVSKNVTCKGNMVCCNPNIYIYIFLKQKHKQSVVLKKSNG